MAPWRPVGRQAESAEASAREETSENAAENAGENADSSAEVSAEADSLGRTARFLVAMRMGWMTELGPWVRRAGASSQLGRRVGEPPPVPRRQDGSFGSGRVYT